MNGLLNAVRYILGNYTPLSGDGINSLNIEYIVSAILLILVFNFVCRLILTLFHDI